MKFGVREICDVVLKAKAAQKIGNKIFYAGEPVCYFDTLKTSSMEGAATTVYAQGGRGNSRLVAWEGERTITFTMEDALISPAGFMILSGAGLIEAGEIDSRTGEAKTIKVHTTEQTDVIDVDSENNKVIITLENAPYYLKDDNGNLDTNEDFIYVMLLDNGEVVTEPYIPSAINDNKITIDIAADAYLLGNRLSLEPSKFFSCIHHVNVSFQSRFCHSHAIPWNYIDCSVDIDESTQIFMTSNKA